MFTRLGDAFRKKYPEVGVHFSFAGTQALRTQIVHGAPADIFASADTEHMDVLAREGLVQAPTIFAHNHLVLITPANTSAPSNLAALPDVRRLVVGAAEVPVGRYTATLLDHASKLYGSDFRGRVEARVVSRELNVRQVLAKVRLGEADAGFVYATDAATAHGEVRLVPLPPEVEVTADYPIAMLTAAPNPAAARAWLAFLRSGKARDMLREAGFVTPRRKR